jgi:hypothetical protein
LLAPRTRAYGATNVIATPAAIEPLKKSRRVNLLMIIPFL